MSTVKWLSADQALAPLRSGIRVFIGSGCAAPQKLVEALAARGPSVFDVEIVHILTFAGAPYARRELLTNFRHNAFFIGPNARSAVNEGVADYTPIFLSEIPALFRHKRLHFDLALVQVTPPARHGFCSLGVSVDVVKAAVEAADVVVAEVNYIHDNPRFEFRPTEFTNDPFQIARNRGMVAISSAIEVDLTGQVCADSIGENFYSGFGGQVDFIRGAARSEGGKLVIALLSRRLKMGKCRESSHA